MKFVPLGDNEKSSESSGSGSSEKSSESSGSGLSENLNSDIHLYRESDARFTRDITRTKGPKLRNSCATNQTESPLNKSIVTVPAGVAMKTTAPRNLSSEQIMKSDTTKPSSSETPIETSEISSVKSSVKSSVGVVTRSSGKKSPDTKTSTEAVVPVAQVNSVPQKPEWIVHADDSYMTVSKVQMHTYFCDECNLKPKDAVSQGIKIAFCNTSGCDLGCTKDTCYCICEKCFNNSSHNKTGMPCYVTMINFSNIT